MKALCVIPARGGSKGIPKKNIKKLCGKPLIEYTVDTARELFDDKDICVSTDDCDIIDVVEKQLELRVPFVRPDSLATDKSGTYEVLLHALDFYKEQGEEYDVLVLLQPTSPMRNVCHVKEAMGLYREGIDMVVSVKESSANPYYNLFEEKDGRLVLCKGDGSVARRQDAPKVYEYNGAVYVINVASLRRSPLSQFENIVKYVMSEYESVDLDTEQDWMMAEYLLGKNR